MSANIDHIVRSPYISSFMVRGTIYLELVGIKYSDYKLE